MDEQQDYDDPIKPWIDDEMTQAEYNQRKRQHERKWRDDWH